MAKEITWNPKFAPSYTPEEMLKEGVFEGKYINNIKGIPASWKKLPKVVGPNDPPDISLNKYGVKSRQGLSVWKANGWIKPEDPNGWFSFYINYFLGRRVPEYDDWQIARWNSFVARHQGQINADPKSKNEDHRLAQKQALLQWGVLWSVPLTEEQRIKNAKRISGLSGVKLAEESVAQEAFATAPKFMQW